MQKPIALDSERLWIDAANVVAILPISEEKRASQGWDGRFKAQVVAVGSEGGLDTRRLPNSSKFSAALASSSATSGIPTKRSSTTPSPRYARSRATQRSGPIFPFRGQTLERTRIVARRNTEAGLESKPGTSPAPVDNRCRQQSSGQPPRSTARGRALANRAPQSAGLGPYGPSIPLTIPLDSTACTTVGHEGMVPPARRSRGCFNGLPTKTTEAVALRKRGWISDEPIREVFGRIPRSGHPPCILIHAFDEFGIIQSQQNRVNPINDLLHQRAHFVVTDARKSRPRNRRPGSPLSRQKNP